MFDLIGIDDWEVEFNILEDEMFINHYFSKHGVFTIEEY